MSIGKMQLHSLGQNPSVACHIAKRYYELKVENILLISLHSIKKSIDCNASIYFNFAQCELQP